MDITKIQNCMLISDLKENLRKGISFSGALFLKYFFRSGNSRKLILNYTCIDLFQGEKLKT
jgi:hypothetical protein